MNYILLLSFILISCSSSEEKKLSDLDIHSINKNEFKSSSKPEKDDLLKWQKYFMAPPNKHDQKAMKSRSVTSTKDNIADARRLRSLGQLPESINTYRSFLRSNPDSVIALIELAQIHLLKNQLEIATNYLSDARSKIAGIEYPSSEVVFKYRYTLALTLLSRDHLKDGRQILSSLISNDQSFIPGYLALAESYINKKHLDTAKFILNRGLDNNPNNDDLENGVGMILAKEGNYRQASIIFNKVIRRTPSHISALINRANISLIMKEYKRSEIDFKKALNLDTNNTSLYTSLGLLYQETGRYKLAQSTYLKALDINEENSFARYNLATLYSAQMDKPNESLQLFYEVLQSEDLNSNIKDLARAQIEGLRESRMNSYK